MLTEDETEAVLPGLRYVDQRGDDVLTKAAANALAKILAVLPQEGQIAATLPMTIPGPKANGFPENKVPLNAFRSAIRTCRRLERDEAGLNRLGFPNRLVSDSSCWPGWRPAAMVRPLSMDLRERAVARIAAGESVRKVARALSVAPSSVVKWTQRLRATGSVAPGKIGGHVPPKIAGAHRAWLVARTAAAAFTLRGLVAELAGRGLRVDYRTVWTFIRREGLSFKKNRAGERAKPSRRRPQARAVEDPPGAH
jgi:putative transposase